MTEKGLSPDQLGAGAGREWVVPASRYTLTPASTSRITMGNTADLAVGLPVIYTYNGSTYYGIIGALSPNAYIDLIGPPLDVGHDLESLVAAAPERVQQIDFFIGGIYGDGVGDLLAADMNTYFRLNTSAILVVGFVVRHKTDDGTSQPKINVKVASSKVSTTDSGNGVQVATSWVSNPLVAIDPATYELTPGNSLEVECTVAGGTGDAADLTVSLTTVLK